MRVDDFDYELPKELIAQAPLAERDASRLMVLPRTSGPVEHRSFSELPGLLREGDLLVVNDARVFPARLKGRKAQTGGAVEILLMELVEEHGAQEAAPEGAATPEAPAARAPAVPAGGGSVWRALCGSSKPLKVGGEVDLGGFGARVVGAEGQGVYLVRFDLGRSELLNRLEDGAGELPLPPYIEREATAADRDRYQTIFARVPGAVAAPTAGLHFTDAVVSELERAGVQLARVTLYVGPGTFLPVRVDELSDHKMHVERYVVSQATSEAIRRARAAGGRVIAVGTTSLRTLEAAADGEGGVHPGPGRTDLFVYPGFRFQVVDGLVTNFHLPRSTLLMLVSGLAGRERVLSAYAEAVERRYRFFSYGDAMLIL